MNLVTKVAINLKCVKNHKWSTSHVNKAVKIFSFILLNFFVRLFLNFNCKNISINTANDRDLFL